MTDQPAPTFDETDAEQDAGQRRRNRRPSRRSVMTGGLGLLALGGAGLGAIFWFDLLGTDGRSRQSPPAYFELPEMTVNLSTTGEQPRYLRINVALELADAGIAQDIEPVLPRIMDMFQVYLRELRATDLEGSAGLHRLKEELVRRVNMAIHPAEIDGVVFQELIVQ